MRQMTRWLILTSLMGCAAVDFPGQPTPGELGNALSFEETPRVSRGQRPDDAPIVMAQATPVATAPEPPPPFASSAAIAPPPGFEGTGTQQASFTTGRSARTRVRAWVNGRPIFNDEVSLEIEMRNPAALGSGNYSKVEEETLKNIIEIEIAYQDAVRKLEKANPTALQKLKEMVDREYEKQARQIRKAVPEEQFAERAPAFRRQLERQFIGMEYIRSQVFPALEKIGYIQIKEYYDAHLNEFQRVDSVKWQHMFLAVNAKRSTLAAAKQAASEIARRVQSVPEDKQAAEFEALALRYDDGDSKTRNGMGFGSRKGEIQPVELEKHLFEMNNGQFGPIVEVTTGVHLFRMIERDAGGQMPLNEAVQSQIRNKLRNKIFEREYKRFVSEISIRAVVEYERGG